MLFVNDAKSIGPKRPPTKSRSGDAGFDVGPHVTASLLVQPRCFSSIKPGASSLNALPQGAVPLWERVQPRCSSSMTPKASGLNALPQTQRKWARHRSRRQASDSFGCANGGFTSGGSALRKRFVERLVSLHRPASGSIEQRQIFVLRRRKALPITDTDEKLIAAAAMTGLSSKPKNG
jgi:hypothetical protein